MDVSGCSIVFDVDEDAIPAAVKVLCWSAIRFLGQTVNEERDV